MSNATSVPMWSITSKALELMNGSFQPAMRGTKMRCAEELTGMNSVSPWMRPMIAACRTSGTLADEERRHDQRDRGEQLDQDVERRARGVLERIADSVTHDGCRVGQGALADHIAVVVLE